MRRVLVVEDDAVQRQLLRTTLESRFGRGLAAGSDFGPLVLVDTVVDGEEALYHLHTRPACEPYVVLISDVSMFAPAELKLVVGTARRLFPAVRVLLLGELAEDQLANVARSVGAHRALPKPWSVAAIGQIVRPWLDG